ncbi:xanthine dehydrogenase family protein molybdopterin-binding subunit [Paracraurococcus lichenis]|uniref:Molybdopterin-dependent oxidoreductase n=1 Tax=Paracraurococcus lichenis TaxID=3064888 RepID=A0ABT9E1Q3_9PROT|nr:molybdopterin cofactor-binding domain-containing protein [Paracraurococcus sp. LOR1-02]MDO9709950.1 molybdopterin-dependent oxidoreductase [Paracraurococcus sp. LOR1-02]
MQGMITRRGLGAGAAGLTLLFSLAPAGAQPRRLPGSLDTNRRLDAWLRIDPAGTVTVCTGKVEIGQGAVTALMQIAAEELDVSPARIRMISGDTARTPDEGFTAGSQSMEYGGIALRYAGAEARAILLGLAAERLGVPAASLTVEDGSIRTPGGAGTTYWAVAEANSLAREATASVAPKPPGQYRIVGTSHPRLDIPAKVTGGAIYVQDMRLPGMLFGRIARPPSYQAKLVSVDLDAVRALPGVVAVVRDGRFLGVVAEREEQAIKARKALREAARWEVPAALPDPARLHETLRGLKTDDTVPSEKKGEAPPAVRRFAATYTKRYFAHASIGPSAAVALHAADGASLQVWSHSQGVFPLKRDLVRVLKLPEAAVTVTHAQNAGCYGHNGADDAALDAALLARAVPGRPVKLQWMRDDEFQWEPYNPAMEMHLAAGLSAEGRIVEWTHEVWSNHHNNRPLNPKEGSNLLASWHLAEPHPMVYPRALPQPNGAGDRNAVPLYDFPNQRIVHHLIPEMPVRTSALRTLGAYANVFALESFMEELAAAAGADPVEFRLRHLKDPRARAVIEAAAKLAAEDAGELPRGFGFAKYKNVAAYVACVAEVSLDRATGAVRVPRVWAAVDAGQVITPDGLRNQIEGGIIQATSWTLKEDVLFDPQGILSKDWGDYPILTFPEVPKIRTVLLNRPEEPPLGAGEASQAPVCAAIANGLTRAIGRPIRALPYTAERVKAALA